MEPITATLLTEEMWRECDRLGNEMIVSKSGRSLFPRLCYKLGNMDPNASYSIGLSLSLCSERVFIYSREHENWLETNRGANQHVASTVWGSAAALKGEDWMKTPLMFSVHLSNSTEEVAEKTLPIHSRHMYNPVLTIYRESPQGLLPVSVFEFSFTKFISTTTYQNQNILNFKVANNKYSRGHAIAAMKKLTGSGAIEKKSRPANLKMINNRSSVDAKHSLTPPPEAHQAVHQHQQLNAYTPPHLMNDYPVYSSYTPNSDLSSPESSTVWSPFLQYPYCQPPPAYHNPEPFDCFHYPPPMYTPLEPLNIQTDMDCWANVQWALLALFGYVFYHFVEKRRNKRALEVLIEQRKRQRVLNFSWAKKVSSQLDEVRAEEIVALPFEKVGRREILSSEALRAYQRKALECTEQTNCVCLFVEDALRQAEELDERAKSPDFIPPPFFGIPISVKESVCIKHMDCTIGFAQNLNETAKNDANVVKQLIWLGAVPFVHTNIPQALLSFGCTNPIYGTTSNPHDVSRVPGGSSGGEAALIAGGGSPLGIGTDVGGSIRTPASFCGIAGFKASLLNIQERIN
ncbi:unnamed protein product [Caenorhabditis auriculariae]|uniref:T-box domain-containing protein n=1 Tax=Caenorhabditis auriculariae TaxID=2777116 RepID=A0A8S1HSX0_9PELO|nr:unnamed protein product [Caenorhabditis auriculariae]